MKEKLANLHLKAYHFCLLFIILTSVLYIIDSRRIAVHIDNLEICLDEISDISLVDSVPDDVCFVLVHCREQAVCSEMEHNLNDIMHREDCYVKCFKIDASNLKECSDECQNSVPYTLIFKEGKKVGYILGIVPIANLMHIYSSVAK